MRVRVPFVVIALVACQVCVADEERGEHRSPENEQGFVSLFDGKTLKGWWQHDGVPEAHVGGKWDVVEGTIVGDQDPPGKGGFLATKRKYGDFNIRFDLKMDYPSDSGVFLRMGDDGKSHQVTLDNRPKGEFGSIYLPWTQGRVHSSPEGSRAFKQKKWNAVEVEVAGEPARIRFWLNGTLVTDYQHTEETTQNVPREGYIALQVHPSVENLTIWEEGNKVRFRNIRVRRLDSESDAG